MVHDNGAMLLVEIDTTTWWREQFNEEENETYLKCATDLLNEVR